MGFLKNQNKINYLASKMIGKDNYKQSSHWNVTEAFWVTPLYIFYFITWRKQQESPVPVPKILCLWVRGKNKLSQLIRRREKKRKHEIKLPLSFIRQRMGCLWLRPRNTPAGWTKASLQERFLLLLVRGPRARAEYAGPTGAGQTYRSPIWA